MTLGFDEDLPKDVYEFNEIRKKLSYEKSGVASILKPAPVTQHLPTFDTQGNATFRPFVGSGRLEGRYALITGRLFRKRVANVCRALLIHFNQAPTAVLAAPSPLCLLWKVALA